MTKRKNSPVTPGEEIAQQILANYDLKDAQDVQDVLKQIFGECKIVCVKRNCTNLLYAPYWGNQS